MNVGGLDIEKIDEKWKEKICADPSLCKSKQTDKGIINNNSLNKHFSLLVREIQRKTFCPGAISVHDVSSFPWHRSDVECDGAGNSARCTSDDHQ